MLLKPVPCRPEQSSRGNGGIKRAKLRGEIPPSPHGFYGPHSGSSRGAVLVRGESLQCIYCTERHGTIHGTQNSQWKPNGKRRHPELPWETWSRSGGLWPWHTAACQVTFHNSLLPPSPGSQLQVFQRDASFTFLKTKQLSCLIWNDAGSWAEEAGYSALILSGLKTAAHFRLVVKDALFRVTLTGPRCVSVGGVADLHKVSRRNYRWASALLWRRAALGGSLSVSATHRILHCKFCFHF